MFSRMLLAFSLLASFSYCSGQSAGDVRLWRSGTSSPSFSYGRLQVFISNEWREVCDVGFGKTEADVACHQLQYRESVGVGLGDNHEETNSSDLAEIGLSDVYCPTNDYLHLLRCSFQLGQHSCTGKQYTLLECVSNRIWDPPYLGQIRIVGSNYSSVGSAQIYCGESGWGTICSSYPFGQTEANTVCRQLGYTDAKGYNHISTFVRNYSLPVLLDDISCPDSKQECLGACKVCYQRLNTYCYQHLVIECEFDALHYVYGSNVSTCEYLEGGFIQERPRIGEVRIMSGGSSGVAQIYHDISGNRTWNQICSSSSSTNDDSVASTFCTQLGIGTTATYTTVSPTSSNLLSISCDNNYPHLLWCSVSVEASCASVISVSCSDDADTYYTGQVRLVGGDYPSEGRVEIYVFDEWSSIYENTYSYDSRSNADSVCRQLGYTGADYFAVGALPGTTGTVRVVTPYCYSTRQCFSKCLYSYDFIRPGNSYYSHSNDLSVNCTFNTSLVSTISYGSKSACEISVPTFPENSGVNVAAAVSIPIVMVFLMCILVTILICVIVSMVKRSNRRARQGQRMAQVGVGYNPQSGPNPQGEGRVFMIPADQIPPQGMIIMPQGGTAGYQPDQLQDEKVPPPYSEEVLPNNTN